MPLRRWSADLWLFAALVGLVSCQPRAAAPDIAPTPTTQDSIAVAHIAGQFLAAFDSLNWAPFATLLSDSVEAFWPRADTPEILRGRPAVEARFHRFFDQIRSTRPGPPYLHLKVADLSVRTYGSIGLVTFQLYDVPDTLGRRTLVFHREAAGWRLVHLHASNLPLPSHP